MNISSVSRTISKLEEEMSASLFNRNTRKMVPTELGEKFYHKVQQILEQVDQLKGDINSHQQEKIKFHVNSDISHFFTSEIIEFISSLNNKCHFEVYTETTMPDVIENNLEFSLSLTSLKDSGLIARKLASGDLGAFQYGDEVKKVFLPSFAVSRKIEFEAIIDDVFNVPFQVIEVDSCLDAHMLAQEKSGVVLSPLFFQQLLSVKANRVVPLDGADLLGSNFGLYLVYTYNRFKHQKGKKIVNKVMEIAKHKLEEN